MTNQNLTEKRFPREWRNAICEYADGRCGDAKTYAYFNNKCSVNRGNSCEAKNFIEALDLFSELKDSSRY